MNRRVESDDFATWTDPETGLSVRYGLPLFGEIDFFCNESFRRIPHGGIENAGLLLGRVQDGVPQIEAFEAIDCEHATGPSFQLSQSDVQKLHRQIAAIADDTELKSLQVLGWFISHSRSDLVMTGMELRHFADVFPGDGKVTVLVKPERLKPTRFAFLIRGRDGTVPQDGTARAMVLPLSARGGSAPTFAEPVRTNVTGGRELPMPVSLPATVAAEVPAAKEEPVPLSQPVIRPPVIPRIAPEQVPTSAVETQLPEVTLPRFAQTEARVKTPRNGLFWGLLGATVAFAALAGWGLFLRSLSGAIPMQIAPRGSTLIVSWPSERTRHADYAALRVNNGDEAPLSEEEKAVATLAIRGNGGDYEVELIVRQWGRESHGYIRFLESPAAGSAGSR